MGKCGLCQTKSAYVSVMIDAAISKAIALSFEQNYLCQCFYLGWAVGSIQCDEAAGVAAPIVLMLRETGSDAHLSAGSCYSLLRRPTSA